MQKVANDVVLINGLTSEIGKSIGVNFAKKGAKILMVDQDAAKVDAALALAKREGVEVVGMTADGDKAVGKVLETHGKIDVLINNFVNDVDVLSNRKIEDLTDAQWLKALGGEALASLFSFCRAAVATMRERKYGRIINVASLYYLGWPGVLTHCAANSAVFGFSRSLALETAKENITVNCVAVGDMVRPGQTEQEAAKLTASIPVARLGKAGDIDHAVQFFASASSKYITGQTLFVCGGKSIHFSMAI